MSIFKKGDRVFHVEKRREGVVCNQPHAGSDKVRVILEGFQTGHYYLDCQLVPVAGAAGTVAEVVAQQKAAPPVVKPPGFPVASTEPVRNARTEADLTYDGDLTLERLYQLRATLHGKMRSLDDRILMLQIQVLVKKALDPVRNMADVESRAKIAQDALMLRKQLDASLAS